MTPEDKQLHKIQALRALKQYNLPILPYKILHPDNYIEEINQFLRKHKLNHFMLRTDGADKYSPSINNATLDKQTITRIHNYMQKYIVFIMHPANIYKNMHSLNILYDNDDYYYIDVVGPGFIATDLNRKGIVHETLTFASKSLEILNRKKIVTNTQYEKQRNLVIKEEMPKDSYIRIYEQYIPLDNKEISYIKTSIPKLVKVAMALAPSSKRWVASMSFVNYRNNGDEPIFWDMYCLY